MYVKFPFTYQKNNENGLPVKGSIATAAALEGKGFIISRKLTNVKFKAYLGPVSFLRYLRHAKCKPLESECGLHVRNIWKTERYSSSSMYCILYCICSYFPFPDPAQCFSAHPPFIPYSISIINNHKLYIYLFCLYLFCIFPFPTAIPNNTIYVHTCNAIHPPSRHVKQII